MRKKKSRILALVLCMAMLLGNSILAFAGESAEAEDTQSGTVVLMGSAADYDVTLTGPAESFPTDGELAVSVEQVSADTEALVKSAVDAQAQAQQMEVADYTALDIRLLCDGQEVQPQGPVSVAFAGKTARDAGPEETKVYHVDETAGTAEDMGASVAEDGQITMETDHFSIYVVVDLEGLGGSIDLTVQHWANLEILDGVNGREGIVGMAGADGTPFNNPVSLKTKQDFCEIYSDDVIELDNTLTKSVEELSKILLSDPDEASGRYELAKVWFLEGGDPDSESAVWDKREADSEAEVTLTKDTTIRFVYNPVTQDDALVRDVTFYDYDVTDGKTYNANGQEDPNGKYLNTTNQGINSGSNYSGGDTSNRLAVGQVDTFVDHSYGKATGKNGVALNGRGTSADVAKKGIVKEFDEKSGPVYDGVFDPGLFTDDPKTGKTILQDYNLVFDQNGDTYTLTSVTKDDGTVAEDNLDYLTDVYDASNRQIFSNNFWPLDGEKHNNQDPLIGGTYMEYRAFYSDGGTRATANSDDNQYHNWFFGMRYSMGFVLGDYTGPLNYYFRGDDDFWLFVDGKLATDLGGIHSSVGELLDLSSYVMKNPENGPTEEEKWTLHRIDIVYAERGAFGSTCYMQFTLPNLRPVDFDTDVPKTEITVQKNWQDQNNPERPDSIQVELYYKKDGTTGETLYDTQTLSAANGWTYTWREMPKEGYTYRIKEVGEEDGKNGNYTVTYGSGDKTDGTLAPGSGGGDALLGTITNTLTPTTYITVQKVWDDRNSPERPDSASFYLYYRKAGTEDWTQYPGGSLTLNEGNSWKGRYESLPVYWGDTKELMEYTVMETDNSAVLGQGDKLDGKTLEDIYTVSYPEGHFGAGDLWTGYEAKADTETLNLTVTNRLAGELTVTKEWKGVMPPEGTVVYAGLYEDGAPVADSYVELKRENNLTGTFDYLTPGKTYTVKELCPVEGSVAPEFTINGQGYAGINGGGSITVSDVAYGVTYTEKENDSGLSDVTITNTANWQIVKRSATSSDIKLEGAVFTLTDTENAQHVYTGTSGADDGIVDWKDSAGKEVTGLLPEGTYTLKETEAPTGYKLDTDQWTITISNGAPTIQNGEMTGTPVDGILTFYFDNEPMYALPSSGGPGIYVPVISGILLMAAGALAGFGYRRKGYRK